MNCLKCNNTGAIETGNNNLACDCPAGAKVLFSVAGVYGPVIGAEVQRHFLNYSPEPIQTPIDTSDLPGRK